jgi:class 3 adenylate cyclase
MDSLRMKNNELRTGNFLILILPALSGVLLIFSITQLSMTGKDGLAIFQFLFMGFIAEIIAIELPYLGYASSSLPLYFTLFLLYRDPYLAAVISFVALAIRTIIINRQKVLYRIVDFSLSFISIVCLAFIYSFMNADAALFSIRNLLALAVSLLAFFLIDLLAVVISSTLLTEDESHALGEMRGKLRHFMMSMVPLSLFVALSVITTSQSWCLALLLPFLVALRFGISFMMRTSSKGDEKLVAVIRNFEEKLQIERELRKEQKAELDTKDEELAIYYEMTGRLGGVADFEKTANTITAILRKLIPCQSCVIFLKENNQLVVSKAVTPYKEQLEMSSLLGLKEESVALAVEKKEPILITELGYGDSSKRIFINERSQMCVPLIVKYEIIGYIYVGTTMPGFYNDKFLNMFISLSQFAANSIFIAQLYESETSEKKRILTFFEKYVSPDVVKEILTKSSEELGLKGERKKVTVLFLDIRGFSSLSAAATPSQVVAQLNFLWAEMGEIIYEFGGTLLSYIGDAFLAVFGAPLSRSDDAARAIAAGLKMQWRMIKIREIWAREGKPQLHIGVGINTGVVLAGDVGFSKHREYTVIGETVNVAARIEKLNKQYSTYIIISETTYQEAGQVFITRSLGAVSLDAKDRPIEIYAVEGVKQA